MTYRGDKVVDVMLESGDGVSETLVKCVSNVLDVVRCVEFLRQLEQAV